MRRVFAGLVLVCVLLLTGCLADPIQDDLLNYMNEELKTAQTLEEEAVAAYEGVSGTNYQDDQTVYDTIINQVIPTYTEFIGELEAVTIESEELQAIHDVFIEGAKLQLDGFDTILEGIETQDPAIIEEANSLLAAGGEKIAEYHTKLKALAEDHNVKIEKK